MFFHSGGGWYSPPGGIEVKRMLQTKFNLFARLQRLVWIGQRDHGQPPVFEMDVILLAQMLDPVHAADQRTAVAGHDLHMLGADADALGPGGAGTSGAAETGRKLICGVPRREAT